MNFTRLLYQVKRISKLYVTDIVVYMHCLVEICCTKAYTKKNVWDFFDNKIPFHLFKVMLKWVAYNPLILRNLLKSKKLLLPRFRELQVHTKHVIVMVTPQRCFLQPCAALTLICCTFTLEY